VPDPALFQLATPSTEPAPFQPFTLERIKEILDREAEVREAEVKDRVERYRAFRTWVDEHIAPEHHDDEAVIVCLAFIRAGVPMNPRDAERYDTRLQELANMQVK